MLVRLPRICRLPICRLPSKLLSRRARRNRAMTLLVLVLVLVLPLFVPLYTIYRPPGFLIRYLARRFPDVLWRAPISRKMVALTIDDAPSAHTRDILEALGTGAGAHATFFVIGSQAQGPERDALLQDMVVAGHELGNHAWRDEASVGLSDEQLQAEMAAVKTVIRRAYAAADGGHPAPNNYFRPGSGVFSSRMRALVDRMGYRIVLGDVYPHDAQISWPRLNAWHILTMVRPGSIIICHDRRSWTVPMLQIVLPELRRRGYEVVTVTRLLEEAEKEKSQQSRHGLG